MKFCVMVAAIAAVAAPAALAQTAVPADPVTSEASTPAAAGLDGNSPIEVLMASPSAKAVLLKHFPDLDKHPAFEMFKTVSLRELGPLSEGNITEEKVAAFEADLKTTK